MFGLRTPQHVETEMAEWSVKAAHARWERGAWPMTPQVHIRSHGLKVWRNARPDVQVRLTVFYSVYLE